MLTFVEAISLAGDRGKQNDDAFGFVNDCAWVIDGATDLHDGPLGPDASDACWIAQFANAHIHASRTHDMEATLREASAAAAAEWAVWLKGRSFERWQSPIASVLMVAGSSYGVTGVDLGDCRVFALGADGQLEEAGGPPNAADTETKLAATQADPHKPLLQRAATIERLRDMRAGLNREGSAWTFGLEPKCADYARRWTLDFETPGHVLLMTDGFSALVDRYRAYDAAALVRAAVEKGLQELGRELRAIETADAGGSQHPRFKQSDDATAVLLRLS